MRIGKREFKNPHVVTVVFPREDGPVVFKAQAVLNFEVFDQLCPLPQAPFVQRPGEDAARDMTDPGFQVKLQKFATYKNGWIIVESLKATEGLEWETVKPNEPETWKNWSDELKKGFFTDSECTRIFHAVLQANSLDDAYLNAARESFLQGEASRQKQLSSPKAEVISTQSGVPAKDLESSPKG